MNLIAKIRQIVWGDKLVQADFVPNKVEKQKVCVSCMTHKHFQDFKKASERDIEVSRMAVQDMADPTEFLRQSPQQWRVDRNECAESYVCADGMIEGKIPEWWLACLDVRNTMDGEVRVYIIWKRIFFLD